MVLFPQAMRDALDEGHIVFRIMEVVQTLDISCVVDRMEERDPRGTRPYHPRMMLSLLMYAYCSGVYSSRRIAAATFDLIPFRVLTGDQHPHFTVINEFRLRHLDAFVDLFLQVLNLCGRAGLLDLEHVSLDGSKLEANASKHKAMSYGRMRSELERLEREIREYAARAAEIDAEEDERYGKGKEAHEIGEELKRREQRLERIAKAKRELEQEARQARERELRERATGLRDRAENDEDPRLRKTRQTRARSAEVQADRLASDQTGAGRAEDDGEPEIPLHSVPSAPDGTPTPTAQRNFTDPCSDTGVWRAMRAKLETEEGRRIYARRKAIVEPVFGQTKSARGFRRFSLRGLSKVRAEWTLVCMCSNLLKLVGNGPTPLKPSYAST